ncbi:MAG: hypothetical protein M1819_005950 [Sarea resinae]|nr:MAG: hypothetical protein M1819_005950 [Sarea resinae]
MQPESAEVYPRSPITNPSQASESASTQHGLGDDQSLPRPSLGEGRSDSVTSFGGSETLIEAESPGPPKEEHSQALKASSESPQGRPSVDRIAEYENGLLSPPVGKYEGPGFKVTRRTAKPGDRSSPIANFPNEVLTHILSYLPPSSLSNAALVSRRFHNLVTTPHAWRVAFSRFFPGPDNLDFIWGDGPTPDDRDDKFRSEKRVFTRLTALASWRSEYILRTQLLRSLARGRPSEPQTSSSSASSRAVSTASRSAILTYNSQLFTTVNHLHARFGTSLNKRLPRFMHGADESGAVSSSDPILGKVDTWGLADPQMFPQFTDLYPGDSQWGLGPGDMVGAPNVMDISQPIGMVYGEACPGGLVYFRSVEEMRGRYLAASSAVSVPDLGVPKVDLSMEAVCSVWIAKSATIPTMTGGLIGIMSGSSYGIVAAYSCGTNGLQDQRLERGEITARWVLSPGVPIISIAVDDNFSEHRRAQGRIWAVALNALGEVFYLSDFPKRPLAERTFPMPELELDQLAWKTGRSVYWCLAEPTRRVAQIDPYNLSEIDGSYSPRSSCDAMGLSKDQIVAETKEIERFLNFQPKHFRKVAEKWDMQRKLEVDFAGDDEHGAGESAVVIDCGLSEGFVAGIKRYTRCKTKYSEPEESFEGLTPTEGSIASGLGSSSIFGGQNPIEGNDPAPRMPSRHVSPDLSAAAGPLGAIEEWRTSKFAIDLRKSQITTAAIDMSAYATMTVTEDPLLSMSGLSTASSPVASPVQQKVQPASTFDIPGHRSRFLAVGTKTGSILIWDMRAPTSSSAEMVNIITPKRIIHTDSPQISSLALSALYLVHGGNDGLVQAWDPLASSMQPIRTLHSRFSSRARRRLVQAEASVQGVGINLFAAGAICLDPDPTVLRGMVSLGTHLRYWSYSSTAADQYKSQKRRLRRSERGSNHVGERFSGTGRGALKDYIASEQFELEREKRRRNQEAERLAGRFGVDLLGEDASEEEILAYAAMLSEESLRKDEQKRLDGVLEQQGRRGRSLGVATSMDGSRELTPTPGQSTTTTSPSTANTPPKLDDPIGHDDLDFELAEAIRLSLEDENSSTKPVESQEFSFSPSASASSDFGRAPLLQSPSPAVFAASSSSATPTTTLDIPIRYRYSRDKKAVSSSSSSPPAEMDDLDFALQLSLAEERSRRETETPAIDEVDAEEVEQDDTEFPALRAPPSSSSSDGGASGSERADRKGKGKAKGKAKGKERAL